MSEYIGLQSLECLPRRPHLGKGCQRGGGVVPSPLLVYLSVEDLSDWNYAEGMWNDRSHDTCETCDPSLFTIAEVVVGLCWFELVIEDSIDGVSYEKITESSPKVGIETFKYSWKAYSCGVYLSEDFERIIALLLDYVSYKLPLLPLNPTAVPWNWMTVLRNSRG